MANPTNADIMAKLAVMDLKIDRVEAQANKTNGRVTKTEEFINALKAVEKYKKDNPTQTIQAPNATTVVVQPQRWFQNDKLVAGVVGVLIAIAAAISIFSGVQQ